MKKKIEIFLLSVTLGLSFFVFSTVTNAETKIDVTKNWTVTEFTTNLPGIKVDDVFKQGIISTDNNQEYTIQNFGNIGNATFTAKKEIPMKKGGHYTLNIIYGMLFPQVTSGPGGKSEAYIDFNGTKINADESPDDKFFSEEIVPSEDMTYTITQHYSVPTRSVGYIKLGNLISKPGISEEIAGSPITVKYLDDNGLEIHTPKVIEGNVGDDYSTTQIDIPGYSFKEINGNATGKITDQNQIVTYIYTKDDGQPAEDRYPLYRVYNKNNGEHFFTASSEEAKGLITLGWQDEGTAWYVGKKEFQPVFRLYNPNSGEHVYTLDKNEYDSVNKAGWQKEGIAFYQANDTKLPIFRLFNPNARDAGSHHYTISDKENTWLIEKGWKAEGNAFFGK